MGFNGVVFSIQLVSNIPALYSSASYNNFIHTCYFALKRSKCFRWKVWTDSLTDYRQVIGFTGGCSTQVVWMFNVSRYFSSSARRSSDIFTKYFFKNQTETRNRGGQKQLHAGDSSSSALRFTAADIWCSAAICWTGSTPLRHLVSFFSQWTNK